MLFVEPLTYHRSESLPDASTNALSTSEQPLPIQPYASLCDVRYFVDEGVAVLRGRVPSFYLKQLAQELVRRLDGVCGIVNELEVAGSEKVMRLSSPELM